MNKHILKLKHLLKPHHLSNEICVVFILVLTFADEILECISLVPKFHCARFELIDQIRRESQGPQLECMVP